MLSAKDSVYIHSQGTNIRLRVKWRALGNGFWLSRISLPGSCMPSHCTEWYLYKTFIIAVVLLRFTLCNAELRYFHQWINQTHVRTSWLWVIAEQQQNTAFPLPVPELLDHLLNSFTWFFQCSLGNSISEHGCSFLSSCCKAMQCNWVKKRKQLWACII